jgi:hypothetical protein
MKSRALAFLALLLTLAPVAMSRAADDTVLPTEYYPLKVKNTWTYRIGLNAFTYKVVKHEKKGGVVCAKIEMQVKGKPVSYEHIGVTSDSIARYTFEGKEAKPPIIILKLPPKKDEVWKVESKCDGKLLKGSFKSGEETIKISGVAHKAVTVTGTDLDLGGMKLNVTYYFVKDIGMVKLVWELGGKKVVIELDRFEPAKDKS